MRVKPYNHQTKGASWLQLQQGGILADEVGLGKTFSAILAARYTKAKTVLVVAPKTLLNQWASEVAKFDIRDPHIDTLTKDNDGAIEVHTYRTGSGVHYTLVNYAKFRNDPASPSGKKSGWIPSDYTQTILAKQYDVAIVDEVHNLSNRNSQRTYWIKKVKTNVKIGLTGSPIRERPDQLWSILNWLDRKKYSSYWNFVEMYCKMDEGRGKRRYRKPTGLKYYPDPETGKWSKEVTLKMLTAHIKDELLVRKLSDVGMELPPLTITDVTVQPTSDQQSFYSKVQSEAVIELTDKHTAPDGVLDLTGNDRLIIKSAGARFIRLLQVVSAPTVFRADVTNAKLATLQTMLEGTDEPMVIMTRFRHTSEQVEALCKRLGRKGDKVGTFATLSTGHNLQDYRLSIFYDAPQSRVEYEQALGRTHRLGQERPQTVYRLRMVGTVDEYAWDLIDKKQSEVQTILAWLRGIIT